MRSTIRPELQRATEAALQDGLAQYEQSAGRVEFRGAETNLGDAIRKLDADRNRPTAASRAWHIALEQVRLPLYDVHWTPAVVVERVTLPGRRIDPGRIARRPHPAAVDLRRATRARIALHDVVYVKVVESSGKQGRTRVELRVRPQRAGRRTGDGEPHRAHRWRWPAASPIR